MTAIFSMGRWGNMYTKQNMMELDFISNSDTNRKYKDYVYRKMLVQEYLKK